MLRTIGLWLPKRNTIQEFGASGGGPSWLAAKVGRPRPN